MEPDDTIIGIAFELWNRQTGQLYYRFERIAATLQQRFQAIAFGFERLWIYLANHPHALENLSVRLVPIRRSYRLRRATHRQ